jgi:hypothetical protein
MGTFIDQLSRGRFVARFCGLKYPPNRLLKTDGVVTSLFRMFAVLAVFGLSAFEDVPLTNTYVTGVHNYAVEAVRVLFPDAPERGQYPEIVAAAVEAAEDGSVNVRLQVILLRGIEFNITIVRGTATNRITAIAGIEIAGAPANEYKWELASSLTATVKEEILTHLAGNAYHFTGAITTVLAYRSQQGGQQANHHAIFADATGRVHSVVFHSRPGQLQDVTVSVFRSLQ